MNIKMAEDFLNPTNIKVVGIGGGGCNAINRMIEKGFANVEFIALNTDVQALNINKSQTKIQIGAQLTRGLGAGANPEMGEKAALESKDSIKEALKDSHMVFITAGMGGGTGTGASPVVAQIAKEMGILTVAMVTKPFDFEGRRRMGQADNGIKSLEKHVDSLLVLPNQRLIETIEDNLSFEESFSKADDILRQGIQGITEIINKSGIINVDFADVRAIINGSGTALMGVGSGSGKDRAMVAVESAVNNPLLDIDINGARGILVNVSGGKDLSLAEYNKIMTYIADKAHPDANIIAGALIDENLQDRISVTLIATSIEEDSEPVSAPVEIPQAKVNVKTEEFGLTSPQEEKKVKSFSPEKETPSFVSDNLFAASSHTLFGKEEIHSFLDDDFSTDLDDLEVPAFMRRGAGR